MSSPNSEAARLLEKVKPEILRAFACIPDFGSLGFTVHFNEGEPVRFECAGSASHLLKALSQRSAS